MKKLLLLVVIVACHRHSALDDVGAVTADEPAKDAITKPVENGPVKVTEKVWPAKPTLGEPIYLRLEIDAKPGASVNAEFQEAGDQKMGRFDVKGFTRAPHVAADGSSHEVQTYTLDAPSSGKQRIPPLRFEMIDARGSAGSAAKQEILTDEVPLDVAPVKTEAIGASLHDAQGKLDPDVGGTPWLWILGIASFAAVVLSGGILLWRGAKRRRNIAAQRSAYDDAVAKLVVLEGRGAPNGDDADAWFVELSAIVRSYLERRYVIRAPELTTEEFLLEAARSGRLSPEHRSLLEAFLERCDRVKFAGYRPDSEESLASLKAARAFVEDTRLKEGAAAA
ncbi:MAG TPA: hypothetical protein VGG74_27925 [Kofleriaceae bacterium]|jgi:hypothetical protein